MKKIIILITALTMLLVLSGCHKNELPEDDIFEPVEELTGIPEVDNIIEDDQIELEPEHEHILVKVEAKPATCVEYVNIEFYICSGENGCGQLFLEDGTQIKKSDIAYKNDHSWNSGEITREATCTETGVKTITCTFCGKTRTDTISKVDHQFDKGEITKESTCVEPGVKTYKCSVCGKVKPELVAKKEHSFDKGTITKESSCTEAGIRTYKCEVCGAEKNETIEKKDHNYGDYEVVKEPTCDENGSKVKSCINCNKEVSEAIDQLGHSLNSGEVTVKPTTDA